MHGARNGICFSGKLEYLSPGKQGSNCLDSRVSGHPPRINRGDGGPKGKPFGRRGNPTEAGIRAGAIMSAAGVTGSTASPQEAGAGSSPSAALQVPRFGAKELTVKPVSARTARQVCEAKHYLHSYPGGALLNFGVFVGNLLLGVAVLNQSQGGNYILQRWQR